MRRLWLAIKRGYDTVVAIGVAAALVALWTWWRGPIDDLKGKFNGNSFDFEGTAPIAYTTFAFALCAAVGTMLRRTRPTVGIALVGFLEARAIVEDRLGPDATGSGGGPGPVRRPRIGSSVRGSRRLSSSALRRLCSP